MTFTIAHAYAYTSVSRVPDHALEGTQLSSAELNREGISQSAVATGSVDGCDSRKSLDRS